MVLLFFSFPCTFITNNKRVFKGHGKIILLPLITIDDHFASFSLQGNFYGPVLLCKVRTAALYLVATYTHTDIILSRDE